ncbi:hypothetical protein GE061_012335 [Apolygus lucorum]|uniref:Beta-1,4-glucuronyltransferase 1 n=1 Tax=Apolygus lucorum TaxID=248454 RepID=A0A6A4JX50_APOLU|nr:hypothetical protein GE061_012335 [Apolygus lucorum]
MIIGSWTKIILLLTSVVAVLQVIHLVLLNHLDTLRLQKAKVLRTVKESAIPHEVEVKNIISVLDDALKNKHLLDSTGSYRIANVNFETKQYVYSAPIPDIALVTQCSQHHIYKLIRLSKRWQGPISVAIYMDEEAVAEVFHKVALLMTCFPAFRENVTISFVSPLPAKNRPSAVPILDAKDLCQEENYDGGVASTNYASSEGYPNNLLRNVARRASNTEFVLVIDVDMLPSENLRQDFLLFATQRGLFKKNNHLEKIVFVVPAFESKENVVPPLNKGQLLSLVETGEVRPFYSQLCSKCQAPTNYDAWLNEPAGAEMATMFDMIWRDPWEPFYISSNNVPLYDERFKQYGFNRISQVCELHVAGYTFSILNNAFLVHIGFKTTSSFHEDKEKDQERNRMIFRQFKAELKLKYIESSRRCY